MFTVSRTNTSWSALHDPLDKLIQPPLNETRDEKQQRELMEAAAKLTSQQIDDMLKAEKSALKKRNKDVVKILLLGQSESGKSTTLKNFRMEFASHEWKRERASWRAAIQLNLIKAILAIVEAVRANCLQDPRSASTPNISDSSTDFGWSGLPTQRNNRYPNTLLPDSNYTTTLQSDPVVSSRNVHGVKNAVSNPCLNDTHRLLTLRLSPLREIETALKVQLGASADEIGDVTECKDLRLYDYSSIDKSDEAWGDWIQAKGAHKKRELTVPCWPNAHNGYRPRGARPAVLVEATHILSSCREDMEKLWKDSAVQSLVKARRVRIQDGSRFFLNDIGRIARTDYEPSDDDVIRCRLRTTGIQEYSIIFDKTDSGHSPEFGSEWKIYDVGGARTMRHAWLPYFEDVNAIIFLAPASCFDERLDEDAKTNRLEDTFLIWKSIISSELLINSAMIIFLNKCDVLKRKLIGDGIQFKEYLPSFGERPNDVSTVVKYLGEHFKDISKRYSPQPRQAYMYPLTAIDTKATAKTLKSVRDSIIRRHLADSFLLSEML